MKCSFYNKGCFWQGDKFDQSHEMELVLQVLSTVSWKFMH